MNCKNEKHWENILIFGGCWHCGLYGPRMRRCHYEGCNGDGIHSTEDGFWLCEAHKDYLSLKVG